MCICICSLSVYSAILEYITNKQTPRVAWLDSSAQLDTLLDRIDSKGVFSDSGYGVLSVALILLKPRIPSTAPHNMNENDNVDIRSCNSEEIGNEKCQIKPTTDTEDASNQGISNEDRKNDNNDSNNSDNNDDARTEQEEEQYRMVESAADKFDLTMFAASSSPDLFQRFGVQVCVSVK